MSKHPKARDVLGLALLATVAVLVSAGSVYSQSLADVARRERARTARERKPVKVYTNDDIPAAGSVGTPSKPAEPSSAEGQPGDAMKAEEAKTADTSKPDAKGEKTEAKPEPKEKSQAELEKEYRDRFAKLRETLTYEQKKLDVMQRELSLMQTQYYSDPNTALREQTFRGQINQRTQEIEQQKAAVAKAQQAISDLEEELRKKGLPAGWSR